MKRVWTIGLIWGFVAWIPFFSNMPEIVNFTLGLPVLTAGYLLIFMEMVVGSIPNTLGFSLSLPCGVALTWLMYGIIQLATAMSWRSKTAEREVQ